MIRLFHVYFPIRTLTLALSEGLIVACALLAARVLWYRAAPASGAEILQLVVSWVVCVTCMYYYDLYESIVLERTFEALARLVQVLGTSCLILSFLFYVFPDLQWGRRALITWIISSVVLIALWRYTFLSLSDRSAFVQRALLIGHSTIATQLQEELETRKELGIRIVGSAGFGADRPETSTLPYLGPISSLVATIERYQISTIVLCSADRSIQLPVDELLQLKSRGLRIVDGCKMYEAITGRIALESLPHSSLLFSEGFRLSLPFRIYKRTCSLLGSIVGLIIAAPLMALVAIAVRLDSKGPALFRQRRIGKEGKPFWLYKFRTMRHEQDDGRPASLNDGRFTRLGKWLRRTRMDELPQFFNILRGDMCFIGPRPFECNMEASLASQISLYRQRWNIWPGTTGWAQVQRGYCETLEDNVDKLRYDLYYIKHLSPALDFVILLKTAKILLLWRGSR